MHFHKVCHTKKISQSFPLLLSLSETFPLKFATVESILKDILFSFGNDCKWFEGKIHREIEHFIPTFYVTFMVQDTFIHVYDLFKHTS